ncbi:putative lysosomal cobalamin transporter [Desmophyllum pertusum]|uniref:Lysosomal cobalamin transporter n=1 Tax=Desmophyllum pertusum TaxID=174260 RepID=A0A9W9Z3Q4_9CNID|nr:putative lysosomal cobalamin transporter [Desmophyllum pertusum]
MAIPHEVLAYGWIPFTVVVVLTFIFSWFYIRFYQDHAQSEVSSTLTGIVALAITLLTTALVPVDIFLVSYMKDADGTWKEWSADNTTRHDFEQTVAVGYYVLYSLVAFFAFILMPFMYFYYEERDEDVTTGQRMCGALKYTIGFLIVAIVLLLVGAFAPLKKPPKNETQWDKKLLFLKDELLQSHNGETSLSLLMGFLSFIGMVIMLTYTAYGMTALPFSMLKGFKNSKEEHSEVSHERESVEERVRMIRAKYTDGHPMTGHDEGLWRGLKEKKNSLSEERDIYRLQTLAGSTNASSAAVHLNLCLVFSSCCLVCLLSSPCFLLAWIKPCIHWVTSLVMLFPNLSFPIPSTLSWFMHRRYSRWTTACLWPLFSTFFTAPWQGSELSAYDAAGSNSIKYVPARPCHKLCCFSFSC